MPKKTKYKIHMKNGTTQEVEGEVVNKIWGIDKRTLSGALSSTDYRITHIPTGAALPMGVFRTLKAAKLMLQEPEFFLNDLDGIRNAIWRFWDARGWRD